MLREVTIPSKKHQYCSYCVVCLQLSGHDGEVGNALPDVLGSLDVEVIDDLCVGNALVQSPQWYTEVRHIYVFFHQVDGMGHTTALHTEL